MGCDGPDPRNEGSRELGFFSSPVDPLFYEESWPDASMGEQESVVRDGVNCPDVAVCIVGAVNEIYDKWIYNADNLGLETG